MIVYCLSCAILFVLIWQHFHHAIRDLPFDGTVSGALKVIEYYRIVGRIMKLDNTGRTEEADKLEEEWGDKLDDLGERDMKTCHKQIVADLKARGISGRHS